MDLPELIKQCQAQNLKAQEQVYRLFAHKLFGVSLKYARNRQEAEDNLQDAFITIFKKIHQFKHKGSFEGWMKRIVVNTALQRYRSSGKVFQLVNEEKIPEIPEENLDHEQYSLEFLLKIVQELPNRYRMVFNLYTLDGYSHKEIAELMNISEGTSKSNLARARKILQQKISAQDATLTNFQFVK
ncbi:MAG: RNA polymerase sigma factor [Mesonia hippocampi]|uniref:RNA polymerase sigma-70 factor (ECF subfamily) n=1 Tax=Mesonia hippocampi TaxID=1628250 RepID=A0A840EML9_9FLAO|nr:RNA polymerase sigma factor [Mesonia hippocampi]MBB4118355.1 RNA polymerase sigma-70 factor (ECF subfamily) [Mesonia hippocampi]